MYMLQCNLLQTKMEWLSSSKRLWRMPSSGMLSRVDPLKRTYVSEERIASIFRVEKSASEEPAWTCSSRLSCQSKNPSNIRTGRVGEWATWEINREERGRSVEKKGLQGAGGAWAGRWKLSGVGKGQGYQASTDPVAIG
jgi:hypothetical protein